MFTLGAGSVRGSKVSILRNGRRREASREGEKSGRTDSSTPSVSANAQKLLNRTARHRFLSTERSLLAAQNKQQIAH